MLFLFGAGFNINANQEAGSIINSYYGSAIPCGYPLVSAILKLSFGLDKAPEGKSVEDLFARALEVRDFKPMEALVDRLMEADYYVAWKLSTNGSRNSYQKFFDHFNEANFLTFNYDCLPEIFLPRRDRWFPEDGYGVRVQAELAPLAKQATRTRSSSLVVHLHGSSCVYTIESDIKGNPVGEIAELLHLDEPLYAFAPDSIGNCFSRYRGVMSVTGRMRPDERVIAPIPDKSEHLKQAFIQKGYSVALPLIRQAGVLIAVGYSFNPYDRSSYHRLLQALGESEERTLLLVSPEAGELSERISKEYPALSVRSVAKTFGEWGADSFRLG
ncbi:MAG TPA: hypothetical protein VJN21_08310 [Candidatus Acidoferrales bacterium]|nr:hypothetical protein [Candidatus Acidoferrales bacterium]